MAFVAIILTSLLLAVSGQTSNASEGRSRVGVEAVFASTTTEWSVAFSERGSAYVPPRLVFLRPPLGHPARGSGYSRAVGLIVDLGDVDAILAAFPDEGSSLVALMVAHEIGHHVQTVLGDDPEVTGASRERQADCLAGWWIMQATDRAQASGQTPAWPLVDMKARLPETLRLLDVMQSGRADGGAINLETHGTVEMRVVAFERGMGATTPWTCLWGDSP